MPDKTHEAYYVDDKGQRYKFSYTGDIPPSREQVLASVKDQELVNARGIGNGVGGKVADSLHGMFTSPGDKTSFFPEVSTRPVSYDQTRRDPNQIPLAPGVRGAPARPPFTGNPEGGPAAIGSAVSHVSRSGVNFVQGFTGSALDDYDNSVAGQNPSQNMFANVGSLLMTPGDAGKAARAGGRAMWNDNGDQAIGKAVPDLAPNTLGGGIYNTAVDIGGDPLNFAGGGLNNVVSKEAITAHLAELMKMEGARDVPVGTSGDDAGKLAKTGEVAGTVASAARPEIAAADLSKWGGIDAQGLASRFPPGEVPLPDGPKALGPLPGPDGKVKNAFLLGHGSDGSSLVAYGEENLPHVINASGSDGVAAPSPGEPLPATADTSPYAIEDEHGNIQGEPLPVIEAPVVQPRSPETGRFVAKANLPPAAPGIPGKTFGLPTGFSEPGAGQLMPAPGTVPAPLTPNLSSPPTSIFNQLGATPSLAPATGKSSAFPPYRPGENPFAAGGELARQYAEKAGQVGQKALGVYDAVDGTARSAMFGYDLSAPLRQGLLLGATRPAHVAKALGAQFRAAMSEEGALHEIAGIANRPNAPLYEKTGLYVPTAADADKLYRREELFAKSLLHKVPVVGDLSKASDRAMSAYLGRLRADVFDSTAAGWASKGITPETHPAEYTGLADYINTFSGRGNLGKFEKNAPALARVLSSPRLQVSRIQTLNPVYYAKLPKATRMLAMRDAAAVVGSNLALVEMAKAYGKAHPDSGVSASTDPRSTDFMKVRIKNTTMDFTGGSGSWARFFVQVGTGTRIGPDGKAHVVVPLEWKTEGKDRGRGGAVGVQLEGRLAPVPSMAWQAARGTNFDGDPFEWGAAVKERILPLAWQDAYDAIEAHGPLLGGAMGAAAFNGAGVSTKLPPDPNNAPREPLPSEKLLPKPAPGDKYNDADY